MQPRFARDGMAGGVRAKTAAMDERPCGTIAELPPRRLTFTLSPNMVAAAQISSALAKSRAAELVEERELEKLNRMFAKAAPLAARKRTVALKRLRDDIAARIHRAG
jgi:DNA-binding transcriptional ArsR family regulator